MNCFPSRMQYYRLLLLLLLKMPSLPPPRRVALCGEERPPGPFPPGPFPPQPRRSGGDALCDGLMAARRAEGEPYRFPSPFSPPAPPRAVPGGCLSGPAEEEGLSEGGGVGGRFPAGGPRASPRPSGRPYCSISPIEAEPSPPSSFPGLYSRLDMLRVVQEQICWLNLH